MSGTAPPDQRTATLLYDAAHRLARRGRRVSAYHLMKQAMAKGPASPQDARAGVWYGVRFQDQPMVDALLDIVRKATPDDHDWLERIGSQMAKGVPFSPKVANAHLAVRGACPFEPIPDRLCYALSSSPPSTSGYATRSHGVATALREAGFDLVGLTRPGYPWDRSKADGADRGSDAETVGQVDYHRIRTPRRDMMTQQDYVEDAATAFERKIAELRPMAVLAASNWESALPAGIAARRLGLPFFYEVRGFWEMTRASKEEGFETTPLYAAWSQLEGVTARAADHVFTLTPPMRDELILRGVPAEKITLLPNACDPAEFTPRPRDDALAATLGLPNSVPVIGYVGSFVEYEGLELLIRACGALRREGLTFRLLVVGSESGGPGRYSAALRQLGQDEGLEDWLIMPGRVPHDQVPAFYSLIDITPFPRMPHAVTERVSPLKPMEAMAMCKAVIVSDVRAMTDMVRHDETGLRFAKGDAGALADALRQLLSDADLRQQLGQQGRAWIEAERDWSIIGRTAHEVITQKLKEIQA